MEIPDDIDEGIKESEIRMRKLGYKSGELVKKFLSNPPNDCSENEVDAMIEEAVLVGIKKGTTGILDLTTNLQNIVMNIYALWKNKVCSNISAGSEIESDSDAD